MHRLRPALARAILPVIGLLAFATACTPAPTYQSGPGFLTYDLSQDGTTVDSGGGPVRFVLAASGRGLGIYDPFCTTEGPTAFWRGGMTTEAGFEGTAGQWKISIGYRTGYLGFCGPALVTLTDPDGAVQLEDAPLNPVTVSAPGCGDDVYGSQLAGSAPLASDPSVTATVSMLICNSAVANSFSSGF